MIDKGAHLPARLEHGSIAVIRSSWVLTNAAEVLDHIVQRLTSIDLQNQSILSLTLTHGLMHENRQVKMQDCTGN